MMELPFFQVDAFADRPFTGNPAGVMPLDAWLPDETLQAIAAENNLPETAFIVPTHGDADYELRWFSPTTEIGLCGHATLASSHVLMIESEEMRFRTRKAGVLIVGRDGGGLTLDLPATLVKPAEHPELLRALGTPAADAFLSYQGAEDTAVVLLPNAEAVRTCTPDMRALARIELMAIVTAPGDETDVVSRVFVPAWGIDEDPVTGSAHAALAPFWAERFGRNSFTAYQASARGGHVGCRLAGERVVLTGRCVTLIDGTFRL